MSCVPCPCVCRGAAHASRVSAASRPRWHLAKAVFCPSILQVCSGVSRRSPSRARFMAGTTVALPGRHRWVKHRCRLKLIFRAPTATLSNFPCCNVYSAFGEADLFSYSNFYPGFQGEHRRRLEIVAAQSRGHSLGLVDRIHTAPNCASAASLLPTRPPRKCGHTAKGAFSHARNRSACLAYTLRSLAGQPRRARDDVFVRTRARSEMALKFHIHPPVLSEPSRNQHVEASR